MTRRRRVLVLSHYFPPIGGGGVQRPLSLLRALAARDWDAVVVTGAGELGERWTPTDTTLDVPEGTPVIRARGPEPRHSPRRARLDRWTFRPDRWDAWWHRAAVEAAADAGPFELVYAWMQPYASAVPAARLARHFSCPWIADLGDPWALDEMLVYPTLVHRLVERRRMRKRLGSAAAIIMSTPEARTRVATHFPELADRAVSIAYGFTQDDFPHTPPPAGHDDRFRIVHTGTLHTAEGERFERSLRLKRLTGGFSTRVDILARSHVFLVEALQRLERERPDLAAKVELHLAGALSDRDIEIARGFPRTVAHGYLPHKETVELMRGADLLFLPMHGLPAGHRAGLIPGKTFEYLASGRRILAAVPEGDAKELLQAAGTATIVPPRDVDSMVDGLIAELEAWASGPRDPEPPPRSLLEPYSRESLAAEVVDVFDSVVPPSNGLA